MKWQWRLPIKLISLANKRGHWRKHAKLIKEHRGLAVAKTANLPHLRIFTPVTVTITRISPRLLDEGDNLAMSAKAIRDGVSQALGVNDRETDKIRFEYRQRKGCDEVVVDIECRPPQTALEKAIYEQCASICDVIAAGDWSRDAKAAATFCAAQIRQKASIQ
jgi:hypothetical protein